MYGLATSKCTWWTGGPGMADQHAVGYTLSTFAARAHTHGDERNSLMGKTEAVVILPDWQVPLADSPKIRRVAEFLWDLQPVLLGHVGDLTDSTQLGRWVRGLREEFDGGLEGGFQQTRE